jgi:hypothetical protein
VAGAIYPSDPAVAAAELFLAWFGGHYARSTAPGDARTEDAILSTTVTVGRRWPLAITVLDTLSVASTVEFEAARAALEQRLDAAGTHVALWVPRGATVPSAEPAMSELAAALDDPVRLPDGRLEARLPVRIRIRRTSTQGSVVTVLGGLSAHWAQFTNKVPGTFQLHSGDLHRLPTDPDERDALMQRIVRAAGQPEIDDGMEIEAFDAWTANEVASGRSYVLGLPGAESDESAATLRRNLRSLLKRAAAQSRDGDHAASALVVAGAATYAEDEKLSWSLKGMDPRLYSGFDIIAVVADGVARPLLQPSRGALPWDAPLA